MINQTPEDQAINRRITKRMGTWYFGDRTQPSYVWAGHSIARMVAGARVSGFVRPSIAKTGWDELIHDELIHDATGKGER